MQGDIKMPRDRKQYSKDMTKEKIAYRNTREFFKPKQSVFKKPIQKETVEGPTPPSSGSCA